MFTFQYFSDIHSEFYKSYPGKIRSLPITPSAPYLLLAGDVGDPFSDVYAELLHIVSGKFKHVFLISGNHEYYMYRSTAKLGMNIADVATLMSMVDSQIRDVCHRFDNVTFLQNEVYHVPDTNTTIFGSTFWSDIRPEEKRYIETYMNDYNKIPGFTSAISVQKYKEACSYLQDALEKHPSRDFIVISHHLPSYALIHTKYKHSGMNSAFASEIELANHPRIKAWVAGHTHSPMQLGKFYVNPIGYPGENHADFNVITSITDGDNQR
jgi:DNA repair exonuclease SbcCD nuclease subunit